MSLLTRDQLARLLVWAFRDQNVETCSEAQFDALKIYCNVLALPTAEAATVITHARSGNVPPTEPVALARWTKGLNLLREMFQEPLCDLSVINSGALPGANAA